MAANTAFMQLLCCHLMTTQDRPHKVYISLKLRAFYTYYKKEKHRNKTCKNVMGLGNGDVGNPDPRGGIEIQLSQ